MSLFRAFLQEAELESLGFNPTFPGKETLASILGFRSCIGSAQPQPQGTLTSGPSSACGWVPGLGLELGHYASLGPPEAAAMTRLLVHMAELVV